MESSQSTSADKKDQTGLGKFWKRFKIAFRERDTVSPSTSRPISQIPTTESTVALEPSKEPTPIATVVTSIDPPSVEPTVEQRQAQSDVQTDKIQEVTAPTENSADMPPSGTDHERRLEKLHATLLKKYAFAFDDEGREVPITLSDSRPQLSCERVQKNVRMRVKYTCHNCKTVYGHDRICLSCQHRRCPDCVRYPPKKIKLKKLPEETQVAVVDAVAKDEGAPQECACHECQTGFELGAEECPNCHHKICSVCLKEAIVDIALETPADTTTESMPEQSQTSKPPEPVNKTNATS